MKAQRLLQIILPLLLQTIVSRGQEYKLLQVPSGLTEINPNNGIEKFVTIKVLFDNYTNSDKFKTGWGYSILIEGIEKNVLFDAGADPEILKSNIKMMGIDPVKIDMIVLSHEHGDHTDGMTAISDSKKEMPVLIPVAFSDIFKKMVNDLGLVPLLVKDPVKICIDLYSSGEFSGPIPEQALVLNTKQGLVVMTGCSHPGIVEMLKEIKTRFGKNVYLVLGGFHLLEKSENEMEKIILEMKSLGVVKCGATHCTGLKQIKMFRDAFGINFVELGAGYKLVIN